jgi:hypothetical protein
VRKFLAFHPLHPGLNEAMLKAGHTIQPYDREPDEEGFEQIDVFAYSPGDPHNGPRCSACDYELCEHCWDRRADRSESIEVNDPIPPCPKPLTEPWEYWVEHIDYEAEPTYVEGLHYPSYPRVRTLVLTSDAGEHGSEANQDH